MRSLLVGTTWYDALSTSALVETEYERLIAANAHILYPGFHFVEFKIRVDSPSGPKKPDYALIDEKYRRWWVVEVELAHHSLDGHVLPQVEALANGEYGREHAQYLASRSSDLDPAMLEDMMLGGQPRVLVIVNAPSDEWEKYLAVYGAELAVVEVFRSSNNDHAFETRGTRPVLREDVISICHRDRILLKFFSVQAPAALGISAEERISIEYDGATSDWKRVDSADKVWLTPVGQSPLPPEATVLELVRSDDARLMFRIVQ